MYPRRTHFARTQRAPSLWISAALACGTAYLYRTEYVPVTAVLMGMSFVTFWDWCIYKAITYRKMIEKPYVVPADVRLLEAIAKMNDNQLTAAFAAMGYEYEAPPELVPTEIDPEIAQGITKSYAISQTDRAVRNGGYLSPLRDTSEGTPERNRRKAFEVWLGEQGLIEPASGPKPAKLIDYHETRRRITNGR